MGPRANTDEGNKNGKTLPEQQQKSLKSLLYLAEIEEYYQTLCIEIDSRSLQLSASSCPADDVQFSADHSSQAATYNACIYAVQNTWSWLSSASYCLQVHTQNAAAHHMFFHEGRHCDTGLRCLIEQLQKDLKGCTQISACAQYVREATRQLLDYQAKVEKLSSTSGDIVPLKWRKHPIKQAMKALSLVNYSHNELKLEENEELVLLDNTQPNKWKVRNAAGKEGLVPSLVVLIPPPDRDAVSLSSRVSQQLCAAWNDALHLVKLHMRRLFSEYFQAHSLAELKFLNPGQRASVVQCLSDLDKLLSPNAKGIGLLKFLEVVEEWQNQTAKMTGTASDRRGVAPKLQQDWRSHQRLIRQVEELAAYCQDCHDISDQTHQRRHRVIRSTEDDDEDTFISKAYIERLKPVELKKLLPTDLDIPDDFFRCITISEKIPFYLTNDEEDDIIRIQRWMVERRSKKEQDEFSSQTIRQTETFVIVGVVDPRTGDTISIYRAINEGIISQTEGLYKNPDTGDCQPIPEAMSKKLILVEFTNKCVEANPIKRGIISTVTSMESISYNVVSVLDPISGKQITILDAIDKGIIDPSNGNYINPVTGECMSVTDAIEKGFVNVTIIERKPRHNPIDGVQDGSTGKYIKKQFIIQSIKDPKTGELLTLEQALLAGLVNPNKGLFINPLNGEEIPLSEAVRQGIVKATPADPVKDAENPNILEIQVLRVTEKNNMSTEDLISSVTENGLTSKSPMAQPVFKQLKDKLDLTMGGIREESSGRDLTLNQALQEQVITLDPLIYQNLEGEKSSLVEAASAGLLESKTAKKLIEAYEDKSLAKLIEKGLINPRTGKYIDPKTMKPMTLSEAIEEGHLNPYAFFLTDPSSHAIVSLATAIKNGLVDPETGEVIDARSGRKLTMSEALSCGLINAKIESESVVAQISTLRALKNVMDTTNRGIVNPATGERMTIGDAVQAGILDIPRVSYRHPESGDYIPLSRAVEQELIDAKTAKQIYAALANMSLDSPNSNIDISTGRFIHPETGGKMSIKEAINAGLLDPNTVFVVDPQTKQVTSLASLIEQGKFNPVTGKFKDPLTGLELSIATAIQKGIIDPHIDADSFIDDRLSVDELLRTGIANNALFVAPNGTRMSLKDAIASGFLTPDSILNVNQKTGEMTAAKGTDMIAALMATKGSLDKVQIWENELAMQGKPKEKLAQLKMQVNDLNKLQNELQQHQPETKQLLEDAQQLLDSNREAKKDGSTQQQYQRLRFNTSDLKVRVQEVEEQINQRQEKFDNLRGHLQSFDQNTKDMDCFLDSAHDKLKDIKQDIAKTDKVDAAIKVFKNFNEDTLSHEDQLQALIKDGASFKQSAKDLSKITAKFRSGLQDAVDGEEDVNRFEVIDSHVDRANERFKGLTDQCTDVMAKLSETAAKNKQYKELCDRLNGSLPAMRERTERAKADGEGDPQKKLDSLNALTADVVAEGKLVEDLRTVGEQLAEILEDLDCQDTPKARQIAATVDEIQSNFDAIQEKVVEKQHSLNEAMLLTHDVHHNIGHLINWVNETEDVFDMMAPISLERAQLQEQIQAHRVLSSDIDNHRVQAENLSKKAKEQPGIESDLEQLSDRFDILESRCKQRGCELDSTVQQLAVLYADVNQLETWLGRAVTSLKRESADFEQGSLRDKIEKLYRQKLAKQDDLEQIKRVGRELIEDSNTGNKNHLKQTLGDIQGKWHDLTELLVQMISFAALREIDEQLKYLDKAENEVNTAEPISTDPETLAIQLRDHNAFHEDLEAKRAAVNQTIEKCNKMLRETTNEEADNIKTKLDAIRAQADLVCKLSNERLALLEEALPLASHFSETHADLQSWLGEIEAEITSLQVPVGGNSEQIRKQQDHAKTTQRIIEDHKPLVEDLNNTGHELMEMCTDEDASDLKEDVDTVLGKYDQVKGALRGKLQRLDEAYRAITADVNDTLDGLLEELHYLNEQVEHLDSISANPDMLRNQLSDNQTLIEDLQLRQKLIRSAKENVRNVLDEDLESHDQFEDVKSKLQDLDVLQEKVRSATEDRHAKLETALMVADTFTHRYQLVIRALRDIQDNLLSQDSPGVDTSTIREQQRELQSIGQELEEVSGPLSECKEVALQLSSLCGTTGRMELQRHLEDVDGVLEDIQDGTHERRIELDSAMEKAQKFQSTLKSILAWLPIAERKLDDMDPISDDSRSVRIQIEQLKVFNVGVKPKYDEIQALSQYAGELKNASPITAENLTPTVNEISGRWNDVVERIQGREQQLQKTLVMLGEVDHAMDDIIGALQQDEVDLQKMDDVFGDPKCIEMFLKKIHLMQREMDQQRPTIHQVNAAVTQMVDQSKNNNSSLSEKRDEMNQLYETVSILSRDRQNQLQDILKEVKGFMGDVEDLIRWFSDFRNAMKASSPMGALPDTAQQQFDKFQAQFAELSQKEDEAQSLLLNGEDMLARCRDSDSRQLQENLNKLRDRMSDTREKVERKKKKLEEHLANVKDFHAMLKIHTDWLNNAEKVLGSFKHPSKIVDRVLQQMQDHKNFKDEIEEHREIMMNIDQTGTYLKYFGRKQDTVYIKNLLISIKLRWKKLVRRADEKGRLLQHAYKEDKRFEDAWNSLKIWMDENEIKMKKYASASPSKVKQDIDELKLFQHQLSGKHPVYYSTMRLGRSLKDRCTKSDPEREILQSMIDELKNKWAVIRSIISQRQNKLDEALLSSGRLTDALASLTEWLSKAENYLGESQPILGDLDTVNILVEQHKAFQQELDSRAGVVHALKASSMEEPQLSAQLEQLSRLWDCVNQLSVVRENRLIEAVKMAEDFNDAVQIVREWLPTAENELKFRALPEDEDSIAELMERHESFQSELRGQQPNIERIRFLAEEILAGCHPNAVRFVKYYLTITQTRWEQALQRSNQRASRLNDALRSIRGNTALSEDLLAWLTEAQALLATKEKDPIPQDLTVVEALVKEHIEFHEELSQKNRDVEKLTKHPFARENRAQYGESNWNLNIPEISNQRITTLQNKWRNVWRGSVDRKKRLQDALDHMLELESFKNFDFELWRQRYTAWVRAKKFRITDFFRRQDKNGDGHLARHEFVEGMIASKFPTNRTELNAVFDIFDKDASGELDYREFVDALRPDRGRKKNLTDGELIHDEIEQLVASCQCRHQFRAQKIGEGKYKFGEKQKICLVRFLNSSVMVRVGGGWVTLKEFLELNDPCKAKGRTNMELRDQLLSPEGSNASSQMRQFAVRRKSTPNLNNQNGSTPRSGKNSLSNSPTGSQSSLKSPTPNRKSETTTKRRVAAKKAAKSGTTTPSSHRSHSPSSRKSVSSQRSVSPLHGNKAPARWH